MAQEQLSGHVPVGSSAGDEARDLEFLGGERLERGGIPLAERLAGRAQLGARSFGPGCGPEPVELA